MTLVVFDRSAYHTASGLTEQIEEFIDENYVGSQTEAEYGSQAGPLSNYEFLRRRRDRGDTAAARPVSGKRRKKRLWRIS